MVGGFKERQSDAVVAIACGSTAAEDGYAVALSTHATALEFCNKNRKAT